MQHLIIIWSLVILFLTCIEETTHDVEEALARLAQRVRELLVDRRHVVAETVNHAAVRRRLKEAHFRFHDGVEHVPVQRARGAHAGGDYEKFRIRGGCSVAIAIHIFSGLGLQAFLRDVFRIPKVAERSTAVQNFIGLKERVQFSTSKGVEYASLTEVEVGKRSF